MQNYDSSRIREELKDGLNFVSPLNSKPSEGYPFKAIIDAAGIPGVRKGKGRLTRKRFIRLVMSTGNGKRAAEYLAFAAHRAGISYRQCLQQTMIPAILYADETMTELNGKVILDFSMTE